MRSDGKARLKDWIETSPQHLAMLCVVRADMTINLIPTDPAQLFFVIVDLHRALNCALVAALRIRRSSDAVGSNISIEAERTMLTLQTVKGSNRFLNCSAERKKLLLFFRASI